MVKVDDYELREDLYYWPRGLTWAKVEPDGRVRIGLTDLAQRLAIKIRFIRTLSKGRAVDQGKMVATLETGKWIGPVESPISGTIEEVNMALRGKPTLVNDDPYGEGWVALLKPTKPEEIENLLHGEAIFEWYKKEIEMRVKQKK
ncbi:MAG: glycine cleavage system protein H [Candidatus Bathyarchaeia archaeon]